MKNTTILLLVIFCCFSCGKDDDGPDNPYGLPNATKSGANTFGCLINGEPWVADGAAYLGLQPDIFSLYGESGETTSGLHHFNLNANYFSSSSDSSNQDYFGIYTRPIYEIGEVDYSQLTRGEVVFHTSLFNISGSTKVYFLDTLFNHNYYNITKLDTEKNIIAAEFSFLLIEESRLDTLFVTEGRFDVVYQPD